MSVGFFLGDLKIIIKDRGMNVDFIDESFPIIKIDNELIENVKKELKSEKNLSLIHI